MMENTGIDLPGEASLSGAIWSKEGMGEVELATASFGQRFEVTPLQMICGFSAVINGGNLVKPYVVQSVSSHDGTTVKNTEPEIIRQVVSKQTSQRAADILEPSSFLASARDMPVTLGMDTSTAADSSALYTFSMPM